MADGKLLHVCISAKKGIAKHEVPSISVLVEHGVDGDAHAGDWHRQISLLAHTDIEFMRAKGLNLKPGAFGENLVIDGLDCDELGVGSQLRIGPVLLELTQIGKVCHTRCAIYYTTGDCIMPRAGLFARVLDGGTLHPGMPVQLVHKIARSTIQAAVVTVSDRCAAGTTRDTAGPAVAELLSEELHARIAWTRVVPDESNQIVAVLRDLSDRRVDLVITVGGTGISPRDITPEATRTVIDRELPGLAEAMRAASSLLTPNALLSRAIAGVRRETLIVNLPGSLKAATENLRVIVPALPHAVKMLRGEVAHPEQDKARLISINSSSE
ncbi:MAG: molybdopterin-binding protein [Terracidiphilus sp.]|nr:molybdopterin-binding protein [Terracidiphilus sp.]MDR3776117.1 molybdopterin-binding protein [Terracidiphilus sp.]